MSTDGWQVGFKRLLSAAFSRLSPSGTLKVRPHYARSVVTAFNEFNYNGHSRISLFWTRLDPTRGVYEVVYMT